MELLLGFFIGLFVMGFIVGYRWVYFIVVMCLAKIVDTLRNGRL